MVPGCVAKIAREIEAAARHMEATMNRLERMMQCLMLVLIALSVNLLGDWLRDALNPRLR